MNRWKNEGRKKRIYRRCLIKNYFLHEVPGEDDVAIDKQPLSVVSQPLAKPHSRSFASHRQTFAQRYSPVRFLSTALPDRGPEPTWSVLQPPFSFFAICNCGPVRFLSTSLPDRDSEPRKQRPYFGDPRSHITRKNTGFRARECFRPWIYTFPNICSPPLLPHANCSCSTCSTTIPNIVLAVRRSQTGPPVFLFVTCKVRNFPSVAWTRVTINVEKISRCSELRILALV